MTDYTKNIIFARIIINPSPEDLTGKASAKETDDGLISFADIVINRKTKEATLADEPFPLTPNEYAVPLIRVRSVCP